MRVVFQNHLLLAVAQYLGQRAFPRGHDRGAPRTNPDAMEELVSVGLKDLANRYPPGMSDAMTQRASIAAASAADGRAPKVRWTP